VTGYDPAAIESFAKDYVDKSYVWSLLSATAPGSMIHDRRVLSPDRRRRDPFANEWATRNDTTDCVVLPLIRRADISAVAVVARPRRSDAFDDPELAFLKRLLPHLQRAIEMNRRLEQSAHQLDVAFDILDKFRDAFVLVTADATVTYFNKAADALFQDRESGVSLVRSRLNCERPDDTALLRRSVAAASGSYGEGPRLGSTMSIERAAHLWPLTLHCLPLTGAHRWKLEPQPAALLLLTDTARSFALAPDMLARVFPFTAAESRLAYHLARGETLSDLAGNFGVSRATLASQLHAIFQKTHTRRQSDLIRLLHALPRLDFGMFPVDLSER
jgi:DNA-binding CsgD family transcriptional regulator